MHNRFDTDMDGERRVTLFPLVASFPQAEGDEDIVWLGAPQIREAFAQTLFRIWAPLAHMEAEGSMPVVVWHTTPGQGYCLMRMVSEQGVWRISALLISREDVLTMGCDPFLLLYGNALPAPDASRLRPAVLSLSQLGERASQVLDYSFDGQEMARTRGRAQGWLDALISGQRRVLTQAADYRDLFLSAVAGWPQLPLVKRLETSLVLAAPELPEPGYMEPCLICALLPQASEEKEVPSAPFMEEEEEPTPVARRERERSISQEARIDITARFLAEADSGVDLSHTAMVRRIQSLEVVGDVGSYRHLLDCLVCGLETRVERLSVSFVLDLLVAYAPRTFALHESEVARVAFSEAILDVARLARVAEHASSALCWMEGLLQHRSYEFLMDAGFESALRMCLRHSPEVDLENVLRELESAAVPHGRWEELRQRLTRGTGDFQLLGEYEDTGVYARPRNTTEKQRHIAAHVEAISQIAGANMLAKRPLFQKREPVVDLESRLLDAWGVAESRGPCLLWQGSGRGGRLHLAYLVKSVTQEPLQEEARSPLGLSLLGPPQSVEMLREDTERVRELLPLMDTDQHWSQSAPDEAFERAGVALRCTPLRNIWASVGRQQGVGGKTEAVLVYPREGGAQWPRLVSRLSGILFVVEAERLIRQGSEVRKELRELVAQWERRQEKLEQATPLQCAIILTGVEELTDPVHAPLVEALREAFVRVAQERQRSLSERVLTDMIKLGELALHAVDDGALQAAMRSRKMVISAFALPTPSQGVHLHDIPLVWIMRSCGMKLNLERGPHRPQWELM